MIIDEKKVKRLIAYFIYDKQGIVDDYIIYMLCAFCLLYTSDAADD